MYPTMAKVMETAQLMLVERAVALRHARCDWLRRVKKLLKETWEQVNAKAMMPSAPKRSEPTHVKTGSPVSSCGVRS